MKCHLNNPYFSDQEVPDIQVTLSVFRGKTCTLKGKDLLYERGIVRRGKNTVISDCPWGSNMRD